MKARVRVACATLFLPAFFSLGILSACGESSVEPQGQVAAGEEIVTGNLYPSCGTCHTMTAAEFDGTVGPNLDVIKPGYESVYRAIIDGPGSMPSYDEILSGDDLHHVAAYVSHVAGNPDADESLKQAPSGPK